MVVHRKSYSNLWGFLNLSTQTSKSSSTTAPPLVTPAAQTRRISSEAVNLHGSSATLNNCDLFRTPLKLCSSKTDVLACRSCFKYFTSTMLNIDLLISKGVYVPEVEISNTYSTSNSSVQYRTITHWINIGYHRLETTAYQNRSYSQGRYMDTDFYILYIPINMLDINTTHIISNV